MTNLAKLGVAITNVHAAGGVRMMQAAKEGLIKGTQPGAKVPELIAVTQLTSTSEEEMHHDQLINVPLETSVIHYAKCAEKAGLDGVVCSALEARGIQEATKQTFICLTPGIRPAGSAVGDQQRVVTPQHAREIGSTYIVVGRPITQAENPYEAYQEIKKTGAKSNMTKVAKKIAKDLLDIEAVFLNPNEPFTWASGIKARFIVITVSR